MIKRTLFFGNPCYLKKKQEQMTIEYKDTETKSVPIEDIGVVVLDNQQITLTTALLMALMENNAAVITSNWQHLPEGLLLPMAEHHAFTEKVRSQFEASEPLRKNLWQQTVQAKITNQANLLDSIGIPSENMHYWASQVKSGDPDNYEARAAAYYWQHLFADNRVFRRGRFEAPPNNLLNYGYAILRGVIARNLVASGLMTFRGIHHKNKYNPYCLADDIMEPYRPYTDKIVLEILADTVEIEELTTDLKRRLLIIPATDINIDGQNSPLMVGAGRTTASLIQCYEGVMRKLVYPVL
ncbi:MAG: type II CRISPR-associated endonuclease Cas1 [Bacteroidales bacterium]|nr:type II CRISPR-associated endonuclease Cas1 [Bacteroidales bacterium]MBN2821477.1 type II CRISPR-associated endonuclease Cas1 [Bacteroidales bacterium]